MLERIKHINSVGESIDSYSSHIFMNYNDLRDFVWKVKRENDKIVGFEKGMETKTVPFYILCREDEADDLKDKFFEHFEIDVLSNKPGYFEINGYKFYCYSTESRKSEYLASKGCLKIDMKFETDQPSWIKETSYVLNYESKKMMNAMSANPKRYTYTYPYKYTSNKKNLQVINDAIGKSDVIIRMFGPATEPFVNINGVMYKVMSSVIDGEYIEINTEKRTIIKYTEYGEKTNLYNFRAKETSDFFAKVPSGLLTITSSDMTSAEVVILEKRSEPKWKS